MIFFSQKNHHFQYCNLKNEKGIQVLIPNFK